MRKGRRFENFPPKYDFCWCATAINEWSILDWHSRKMPKTMSFGFNAHRFGCFLQILLFFFFSSLHDQSPRNASLLLQRASAVRKMLACLLLTLNCVSFSGVIRYSWSLPDLGLGDAIKHFVIECWSMRMEFLQLCFFFCLQWVVVLKKLLL